jgi:hypothetical protein
MVTVQNRSPIDFMLKLILLKLVIAGVVGWAILALL